MGKRLSESKDDELVESTKIVMPVKTGIQKILK